MEEDLGFDHRVIVAPRTGGESLSKDVEAVVPSAFANGAERGKGVVEEIGEGHWIVSVSGKLHS